MSAHEMNVVVLSRMLRQELDAAGITTEIMHVKLIELESFLEGGAQ